MSTDNKHPIEESLVHTAVYRLVRYKVKAPTACSSSFVFGLAEVMNDMPIDILYVWCNAAKELEVSLLVW